MSYEFPAHESTRKRRRWGCTCGCVMLLIVLIIVGGLVSWLGLKPHETFPRYALMDGEVDGFGVLRVNSDDDGTSAFMHHIFNRMIQASKADPGNATKAKAVSVITKYSKNLLSQFFQEESMIYATYNPVTADENIVFSAPLENRMSWWALRQFLQSNLGLKSSDKENGADIYPLGKGETPKLLALNTDELMITDSRPLLDKSLKYAKDSNRAAIPSEKLQYFIDELSLDEPPEGQDMAFALVNEESRITNLIFSFEEIIGITGISDRVAASLANEQLTFGDITGMKITADLASADQLNAELTMYCPNSDTASRLTKVFTTALPALTGENSIRGFKLEGDATARGVTAVVALEITGLEAWIDGLIPVEPAPDAGSDAKTPSTSDTGEDVPATAVQSE